MEYQLCGWEISCDDFSSVNNCSDTDCTSGCFCSDGIILQDGVCIHPDTCPSKQCAAFIIAIAAGNCFVKSKIIF